MCTMCQQKSVDQVICEQQRLLGAILARTPIRAERRRIKKDWQRGMEDIRQLYRLHALGLAHPREHKLFECEVTVP